MRQLLTFAFVLFVAFAMAQDEDDQNLVPNGGFEDFNKKALKSMGQLQSSCEGWFNATQAETDLYASGIKSAKVSIPMNDNGKQEAAEGEAYAGFRAYTKDKKKNRSYLEIALKDELEKDQMYCLSFKISVSDLSKYSVNYVGAVVSDRKIYQSNTGAMVREIDVKERSNKVIKSMDAWETVCGTVVGTGREDYLVIGCFGGNTALTIEKNKRPRDVVGAQTYDAYYYIDDVKLVPVYAKSQCNCSSATSSKPDLIYGSSTVITPEMNDTDVLAVCAVYFPSLKKSVNAAGVNTLNKVVEMMTSNADWTLEIIGHSDNDEAIEGGVNPRLAELGKKRAEQVKRYLVSKGVSESRLIVLTKENTSPATTRETEIAIAQNRRVTFAVRK